MPSLRLDLAFLLLTLAAPGQPTVNSEALEKQSSAFQPGDHSPVELRCLLDCRVSERCTFHDAEPSGGA